MVPAALTIGYATAVAVVTPALNTSSVNVIVGASVYPPPPDVTVIIPTTPSPIVAVAAAPLPV